MNLIFTLLFAFVGAWGDEAPESRANQAAFPPAVVAKDFDPLSPAQTEKLIRARSEWIGVQRLASERRFRAIAPDLSLSAYDKKTILKEVEEIPVFACRGECPCTTGGSGVCVRSKPASGGVGVLIAFKPCLLSGSCRGFSSVGFSSALDSALTWATQIKTYGRRAGTPIEARIPKARELFRANAKAIEGLLDACPGARFSSAAERFLRDEGRLKTLGETQDRCASRYLALFTNLPKGCERLERDSSFRKTPLRAPVASGRAVRCDGICQALTCFPQGTAPRRMQFGERTYVSLPEGACDGPTPTMAGDFLTLELAAWIKRAEFRDCRDALRTSAPNPTQPSLNGPDVRLIDPGG